MADTTERTLKLLALLQAHRLWSATELADRLDTTERTVRRDVERLRTLGYPVQSVRGNGGGYQLSAGGSLPPLVVDEEEAVAIVAALRSAASGAAAGLADGSVRALAKVTQVLPGKLRRRAEAVQAMSATVPGMAAPAIDAEHLTTVALACRDTVELTFGYSGGTAGGQRRRVEPLRLVPLGRRWYLVAFDLDRADWRTFRLDRLTDPQPGRRSFRPREIPGGDPAAYVQQSLRRVRQVYEATALVHMPFDEVKKKIQRWAEVSEHPGGAVVTMRQDDPAWIFHTLAFLDADYEFLEVSEEILVALRTREARNSRALYLAGRSAPADGHSG
ncbi:helix-turn-helix transcriptional regulator [Jongsikchunia kroppenstedtii]|uniref:helix-turn-helix transcriptional regulator n=1 Tax=Jongsikchunia kroppenstedtii TaxID=1121721 RepID=UPI00036546C3|nr:YafY family protein [Jongsikchunia kroppenstedtii]